MSAIMPKLRFWHGKSEPQSMSEPISTLGLRIVNPDRVEAAIDIVFIHGLTGDRESTWTAKGAAACWPESLLVNDIPQARIIMYGYDADVLNFWSMASQNTVGDHSQKFLTSLANLRDSTNTNTRPLAFVAHSMGGIVCQDALLKSKGNADRHTQHILEETRGIFFMGTPHCGSGLAEWAVVGSKFLQYFRRINHRALAILQEESEVMERIRREFHTMLRARDNSKDKEIAIICFHEEIPVRAIGQVVPQGSAILDRYTSIPIHANHMDMTKFSSDEDPDYRNVLCELQRLVQSLEPQLKSVPPFASSASSTSSNLEVKSHYTPRNEGSSVGEQDQTTVHEIDTSHQPTRSVNNFSGNFYSNGGKITQGG